jgi:acyl-coenzyme A synthetase/AMP-(fatty) acid ligase
MLYERWHAVALARPDELAMFDAGTGERWTFRQLLARSDASDVPGGPVVFPTGAGAGFVHGVLQGWRHGAVVCPLDQGQSVPEFPLPPGGIVHLKTTSATTGVARLVAFTGTQLAADARNVVGTMGLRENSPNLGAISLAHSYGFSNLVLPLLLHGVPLLLAASSLPESLRRAAQGFSDLTLAGVPALWRAWHDADAIPQPVRLAISAGAPLPLGLEEQVFRSSGLKIHNFYGSSECGGIAYDRTAVPRVDAALAGTALDGVELGMSSEGCLVVRGEQVAEGYWPGSESRLGAGVFCTSDLVDLDEGRVFIRGRAGDVIHVAGRKVAPEEIERALARHPGVRECLVLGIPGEDGARGETIVAVVVAPGAPLESLRTHLAARLPAWQIPRAWHFVDALGANDRGKTPRALWRSRLLSSGGA